MVWYGSDPTRGAGFYDIVSQSLAPTLANVGSTDPSLEADAAFGRVMEFNDAGRDQEAIQLNHLGSTWLHGSSQFTLMLWCQYIGTSPSTDQDSLIGQWNNLQGAANGNAERAFLRYNSNDQELDLFGEAAGSTGHIVSAPDVDDGEFHLLGGRWDGSDLTIVFDGAQLGSTTAFAGPIRTSTHSKVPEVMGSHQTTGSDANGAFDSPRFRLHSWYIWSDRYLADAEVWALYDPPTRWNLYEREPTKIYVDLTPTPFSIPVIINVS